MTNESNKKDFITSSKNQGSPLKNISIRWRLIGGFSILCLLTLLMASGGYYAQDQLASNITSTTHIITIASQQQKIINTHIGLIRSVSEAIKRAKDNASIKVELSKITNLPNENSNTIDIVNFITEKLSTEKFKLIENRRNLESLKSEFEDNFSIINENILSIVDTLTFEVKINTATSSSSSQTILDVSNSNINQQLKSLTSTAKDTLHTLQMEIDILNIIMQLELHSKNLLLTNSSNDFKYARIDLYSTLEETRRLFSEFYKNKESTNLVKKLDSISEMLVTLSNEKKILIIQEKQLQDSNKLNNTLDSLNTKFNDLKEYSETIFDTINFEVQMDIFEAEENIGTQISTSQKNIRKGLDLLSNTTEKSLETVSLALQVKSLNQEIQNQVKDVIFSNDIKKTKYATTDISENISNALNALLHLPENEASLKIRNILDTLINKIPSLVSLKRNELISIYTIEKMFISSNSPTNKSLYDLIETLEGSLDKMSIELEHKVQVALEDSSKNANFWKNALIILGATSFLFALIVGVAIFSSINKPLIELGKTMFELIRGNFNYKCNYQAKDEIGTMAKSLQDLFRDRISSVISNTQKLTTKQKKQADDFTKSFKEITTSSESLKIQSGKISESSNVMAINVSSVAEATVGTSKNISEVNISIEKSVGLLKDLDKLAKSSALEVDELAEISKNIFDSIHQVAGQMSQYSSDITTINGLSEHSSQSATRSQTSVQTTLNVLTELEDVTEEIFGFIDQIAEISTQTNVLSLNAAIEACQTTDNLGGFRVVAEEVKKLAVQTQKANSKLARLVKTAQNRLKTVMKNCENAFERSTEVNENNLKIAEMMAQQAEAVVLVSNNIESISSSCSKADSITDRVTTNFKKISQSIENTFLATKTMGINASECENHIVSIVDLIKKSSEEASRVSSNLQNVNKEIIEIDNNVVESQKASQVMYNASKELDELMTFFKEV